MTAPRRPPSGGQARAERSRQAVIDETVRYVLQEGFAPPSMRQITERAGLTWGAVQYHFGDLNGILMAVVDKGFADLLQTLDDLPAQVAQIRSQDRPAFVVEAVWRAFSSPTSMAALEILIATRAARTASTNAHLTAMTARMTEIGEHLATGITPGQASRLGNLIWSTIRGLVALQLTWPTPLDSTRNREMLVEVIRAYLASAPQPKETHHMPSPQTVEFSGVDGITLVADEWNRGVPDPADRPTILMLHGGGQNRFSWKNTGQVLADDGYHVIAIDTRGHGDSDRAPDADYDVETLTADVMHVLDVIGRPVVIIGASMGGLTGILVADRAGPQKVTKLVLVDVVPRFEKNGSARIRDFMMTNIDGFETLEQAADAVAAYLPHRTRPRSPEGLKKNLRLRDGRWYWHWDPAFMTKPGDDPELRTEGFEQAAADLTIPVLLIRGKLSDVVSPEGVQHFLSQVPGAEFVELSDAGHTAAGDDNDAFSEAVVRFVEG